VLIFPLVLGEGKRLFGNGAAPAGLKLVKSRSFPTGVIVANYRPDGAVKTGDFQLAEPTEARARPPPQPDLIAGRGWRSFPTKLGRCRRHTATEGS
jgi:hypothetical protein